jgi:hypothetical protein
MKGVVGMYVLDFEEVLVEILEFTKSVDVDYVLYELDHPEERKGPENEGSSPGDSERQKV